MKDFKETNICMELNKIMSARQYGYDDECTLRNVGILFQGMAVYLGGAKSKDNPVAVILTDYQGNFHFGAYVQYLKPDDSDEGSWTLNYTFNEDDIDKDNWKVVNLTEDNEAFDMMNRLAQTQFGVRYKFNPRDDNNRVNEGSAQELLCTTIDVVKNYMKANVTIDPDMQFDRYFTMSAKLESDYSVYIGVVPSALMKQYVKDDAAEN